jgi:hypothetical protein
MDRGHLGSLGPGGQSLMCWVTDRINMSGRAQSWVSIPRGTLTVCFVRATSDSACTHLFGSLLLPPNARCLASLQQSTDFGVWTSDLEQEETTWHPRSNKRPSSAYERKTQRNPSSCNVPTLGKCGIFVSAVVTY